MPRTPTPRAPSAARGAARPPARLPALLAARRAALLAPLLAAGALSACGSGFPGALPPAPVWVSVSDEAIHPQDARALYAKGSARGARRIDQRRALAEAAAVGALRGALVERARLLMGTGDGGRRPLPPPAEVEGVERLLERLAWQQAVTIEERYFDAERDTQHALARLTADSLRQLIIADPSDGALKAAALEYTGYALQSLRP